MSSSSKYSISRRRKKSPRLPDLRHAIAEKQVMCLRQRFISVIGDDRIGRYTLLRRFLNMNDGPFQQPEDRRSRTRAILVDVEDRPNIRRPEIVQLLAFVFNFQQLDFETIYRTIAQVHACVVMFDVACGITLFTAIHCMVKITELLRCAPRFILVGNKIDLPEREILEIRGNQVAAICGAERYYECSALMNINMDAVLDAVLIMAIYPFIPLPP